MGGGLGGPRGLQAVYERGNTCDRKFGSESDTLHNRATTVRDTNQEFSAISSLSDEILYAVIMLAREQKLASAKVFSVQSPGAFSQLYLFFPSSMDRGLRWAVSYSLGCCFPKVKILAHLPCSLSKFLKLVSKRLTLEESEEVGANP